MNNVPLFEAIHDTGLEAWCVVKKGCTLACAMYFYGFDGALTFAQAEAEALELCENLNESEE